MKKELLNAQTVLRIAAAVTVVATAVQFVIWLLIVLISGHLANPWWMWTLLAAGVLAAAGRLLNRSRDAARSRLEAGAWDAR